MNSKRINATSSNIKRARGAFNFKSQTTHKRDNGTAANETKLTQKSQNQTKTQASPRPASFINSSSTRVKSPAHFTYVCSGCEKPIKGDKFLLMACDKYWHENCLKCDRCHSRLGELGSTLYFKSNMNLCRQDYLELFGETGVCSVCEKIICASEMVMRAKENVYHLECFACQLCSQRFCVGDRFHLWENKVVCQYDYEEHVLPIQNSLTLEQQPAINDSTSSAILSSFHLQICQNTDQHSALVDKQQVQLESPLISHQADCMLNMDSYFDKCRKSDNINIMGPIESKTLDAKPRPSSSPSPAVSTSIKPPQCNQQQHNEAVSPNSRGSFSIIDEEELRKKLLDLSDLKSKNNNDVLSADEKINDTTCPPLASLNSLLASKEDKAAG